MNWLDPSMGIVGTVLIVRWSLGLLKSSMHILLDMKAPLELFKEIKTTIESDEDNRISDLHVWAVEPGIYAAEIALVTSKPQLTKYYCDLLPKKLGIVHLTVETHK